MTPGNIYASQMQVEALKHDPPSSGLNDAVPNYFLMGREADIREPWSKPALNYGNRGEDGTPVADDEVQRPVDVVIDQLHKRAVAPQDRTRLGDALDKANAPLAGRDGADAAVGKAIGG